MSQSDITLIAIGVAVILAFVIMILFTKKVIRRETVEGIADVIRDLPVTMGSGLFGKIYEYSRTAVLAVEQLVKNGEIEPDNEARKNKAMGIVQKAAQVDDVPFGAQESEIADACIEAQVQQLPRNQKTVSGDAGE